MMCGQPRLLSMLGGAFCAARPFRYVPRTAQSQTSLLHSRPALLLTGVYAWCCPRCVLAAKKPQPISRGVRPARPIRTGLLSGQAALLHHRTVSDVSGMAVRCTHRCPDTDHGLLGGRRARSPLARRPSLPRLDLAERGEGDEPGVGVPERRRRLRPTPSAPPDDHASLFSAIRSRHDAGRFVIDMTP